MNQTRSQGGWPPNVGIIAMEIYFPSYYVDQSELESFDGVSSGKYTIGLGQTRMGFCSDIEDIHSLCLTVVQKLMRKTGVGYEQIGRLEVGTETLVDKSKSVKSVLMQLFEESGNSDVEGVDTTNACYGGTSALLNSVAWVESSAWDGRYALVVAGDIAVYATGNARATGGAGAVAMLIGPDAALVLDRGVRATHMAHAYDFYKPDLSSEYPRVDGKLTVVCYTQALDKCYAKYCKKAEEAFGKKHVSLDDFDGVVFHAPYCKLVQKSIARLMLSDFLRDLSPDLDGKYKGLEQFRNVKLEETYNDRALEQALMLTSKEFFQEKTKPSLLMATEIGNMYTASLYGCLASFIHSKPLNKIAGKRIALFSYGSGMAATLFSITVNSDTSPGSPLSLLHHSLADLKDRLENRIQQSPQDFTSILKLREDTHHLAPYVPTGKPDDLFPGTWYLVSIDDMHRRSYKTKQSSKHTLNGIAENGVAQTCQAACSKKMCTSDCEKTAIAGSVF